MSILILVFGDCGEHARPFAWFEDCCIDILIGI